ncbi:MAG: hypothetical protein ACTSVI_00170 [Promethearchaeota archaeon]
MNKGLIQLLNESLMKTSDRVLFFEGIDEENLRKFKIKISLGDKKRIDIEKKINDADLCKMLWNAGMLRAKNFPAIMKIIKEFLKRNVQRPKALAIDTNLVYSRFIQNVIEAEFRDPYESILFFIIIGRGTNDEMHYKTSVKYRGMPESMFKKFVEIISSDSIVASLLTNTTHKELIINKLRNAANRDGRLGLKGLLHFRELQSKYRVIVSKPLHLYYAKEMISRPAINVNKTKSTARENIYPGVTFPDAVFDSIIRHEIAFIRDNTNIDVLFLTADKNNDESSETEGLEHVYVQQPTTWMTINNEGPNIINVDHVEKLLVELLTFSPFIKVSSTSDQFKPFYLAYTWIGKLPEENLKGKIQYSDGSKSKFYQISSLSEF